MCSLALTTGLGARQVAVLPWSEQRGKGSDGWICPLGRRETRAGNLGEGELSVGEVERRGCAHL